MAKPTGTGYSAPMAHKKGNGSLKLSIAEMNQNKEGTVAKDKAIAAKPAGKKQVAAKPVDKKGKADVDNQ